MESYYESERIPYTIHGSWTPDFLVKIVDRVGDHSSSYLLECKGYFRIADKRKLAAVKKCNPHLDIRLLFYEYNKKDIKWAIKYGFPYAVETIPKEWLQ